MRSAIRAGMASTDPQVQTVWKLIAPNGIEPSLDVFLDYTVNRIVKQN